MFFIGQTKFYTRYRGNPTKVPQPVNTRPCTKQYRSHCYLSPQIPPQITFHLPVELSTSLASQISISVIPPGIVARTPAAANTNPRIHVLTILILRVTLACRRTVVVLICRPLHLVVTPAALRIHANARGILRLAHVLASLGDRGARVRVARCAVFARVQLERVVLPVKG